MARFDPTPSPSVAVAEPPAELHTAAPVEPFVDTSDLSVLERAFHGPETPAREAPTSIKSAQLTVSRNDADDFQDRQIYFFVDDEPWGNVRYGQALTRDVVPGTHKVRAFNTLFSKTLMLDIRPGEHVRLRTANGFPTAGFLLMMFLHVTYLLVRLEREPA
jgi:hypothetical protein